MLAESPQSSPAEVTYPSNSVRELPPTQRTPTTALVDFDGEVTRVRANNVRGGRVSRQCIGFSVHVGVLLVVALVALTMMIIEHFGNNAFFFWSSLLTFAIGAILPAPKLQKNRDATAAATTSAVVAQQ